MDGQFSAGCRVPVATYQGRTISSIYDEFDGITADTSLIESLLGEKVTEEPGKE
jgi:hypothetical protein